MAATALEPDASPVAPARQPAVKTSGSEPDDAGQATVERVVLRSIVVGMAVGAAICAAIWMGIVTLALAGSGVHLGPMLLVGAACGVFAGMFLGGWAGSLVGASKLEHYEHDSLPGH